MYEDIKLRTGQLSTEPDSSEADLQPRAADDPFDLNSGVGDIFHALYEAILYGQKQHVSFKIKSPEGAVYVYDLVCDVGGHCDVRIQSKVKEKQGSPRQALDLFLKGDGEVQFIQPDLKVQNLSSAILQSLKGINERLNLVDNINTFKMKEFSEEKKAEFVREVLQAHNKLREHHGAEPLALEKKLMEDAQSYAEQCARGGSIMPRNQVSPYGENIWGLTTNASDFDDFHGYRPVGKWYSEVRHYVFGQEPEDNSAGNSDSCFQSTFLRRPIFIIRPFTNEDAEEISIPDLTALSLSTSSNQTVPGSTTSSDKTSNSSVSQREAMVCEYHPPGNYLGEYAANVKPLQKPFTNEDAEEISIPDLTALSLSSSNQTVPGSTPSSDKTRNSSISQREAMVEFYTLKYHNEKRELHLLPPLSYNKQLSALALDWANQLLEADKFSHRPDNKFGENIFFYTSSFYVDDKEAIKKAVTAWYNEIEDYREYFDLEPPLEALTTGNPTGHFTQVVWNGTTEVGLGLSRNASSDFHKVIVVANYAPPGNILGRFKENVPMPAEWKKKKSQRRK
ncbi:uncharacterized protein LOC103505832 [Diaphorina citri]|uniref:Uncharacterized protein LOC103505832 n=1 Tax=Diaphorina citri TaxID=121845 RepID=A0A3Q0IKZ8_DIACI|nr:uncharacterized protein LOC103505832 [Diaphorina citri]